MPPKGQPENCIHSFPSAMVTPPPAENIYCVYHCEKNGETCSLNYTGQECPKFEPFPLQND